MKKPECTCYVGPATLEIHKCSLCKSAADHALLLAAMCNTARAHAYFEMGFADGELRFRAVCIGSHSFKAQLDEFGCPILTDELRKALEGIVYGG